MELLAMLYGIAKSPQRGLMAIEKTCGTPHESEIFKNTRGGQ